MAPAAQFPDGILSIEIRDDGLLGDLKQVTSWPAASYAALDEPNRRLFVLSSLTGDQSSRLGSYAYDQEGMLRELGDETVEGREACHLCVDPLGRYVLSAHFSSGTLAVNPIDENGCPGRPKVLQVQGSGPHPRQNAPHPHMVVVSPDKKWVVTADLGTDEIATYNLDYDNGSLVRRQNPPARIQAGGGARHFVFHPSGSVFACGEIDSSVATMAYDPATGTLRYRSHVTTLLDARRDGPAHCGAIRLSPDGRYLHVANRRRTCFFSKEI